MGHGKPAHILASSLLCSRLLGEYNEHKAATIEGFVRMKNRLKALLAPLLSFRIRVFALVLVGILLPLAILGFSVIRTTRNEFGKVQRHVWGKTEEALARFVQEQNRASTKLMEFKLRAWYEQLKPLSMLAGDILENPRKYQGFPLTKSPLGFRFSSLGQERGSLLYPESPMNLLDADHFSKLSYLAPALRGIYDPREMVSAYIAVKNRAYLDFPPVDYPKLVQEGKLNLESLKDPFLGFSGWLPDQKAMLTDIYIDLYGSDQIATFMVPIRHNGEMAGIAALDVYPDRLVALCGATYLVDPKGSAAPEGFLNGGSKGVHVLQLHEGVWRLGERLVAASRLSGLAQGWWVVSEQDLGSLRASVFRGFSLNASVGKLLKVIALIVALAFPLALLVAWVVASGVFRAFGRIRENLELLGSNKFADVKPPKDKWSLRDELWRLEEATYATARLVSYQMQEIERLSDLDPLTHLFNRRPLYRIVDTDQRKGSVLLMDADHFKQVNDSHGHDAGDAVLQAIANTVRGNIRDVDMAVRWGGEEVLVYLPNTEIFEAALVAERLRGSIATLYPRGIPVTVSIGVVSGALSAETLKAADTQLYLAKERGRNRVFIQGYGEELPLGEVLPHLMQTEEPSGSQKGFMAPLRLAFALSFLDKHMRREGYRMKLLPGVDPKDTESALKGTVRVCLIDTKGDTLDPQEFEKTMKRWKQLLQEAGLIQPKPGDLLVIGLSQEDGPE